MDKSTVLAAEKVANDLFADSQKKMQVIIDEQFDKFLYNLKKISTSLMVRLFGDYFTAYWHGFKPKLQVIV
jgi:hypothetical protein